MRLRIRNGWHRVWALPWQWKGLGLVVTLLFAVGIGLSVVLGSNDNAGSGVTTSAPTSTAAAKPTSTGATTPRLTPSASPTSIATSEASQETPPQQLPSPTPTPKFDLTAAEVVECEFGQFDGWDDAFYLRSYGSTLFPASLKATTDPVACEGLWLTSYDGGYSNGTNDRCSLVLEYIDGASPEELVFCGLEAETTPTPTPAPTPAPIDCSSDALVVGDRVKGLYQAKGYPATTYEGLSSEADDDYYGLCAQSSDGYVDIYGFCYGVDAWRYFFDQEAGAQEWLDDCFARKFF